MDKSLSDIYDGFADSYDQNRNQFDISAIIEQFYNRFDGASGALLDLGCGAGEPFSRYFCERGWQVTGVDFSEKMLQLARQYVPQMQTIHADIGSVEFDAAKFDAISAIYSLFHIPHSSHARLFENIYHWLKPRGSVLFTYATRDYTGSDEFDGHKEFMGNRLYYSHTTPEQLFSSLRNTGFEIIDTTNREIGGETFLWVTLHKGSVS